MPQDIRPQGYFPQGTFIIPATQVERQRKLAAELAKTGGSGPVQHWSQGAARLVGALGSVLQEGRANEMEQQRNSTLAEVMRGNISPEQAIEMGLRSGDVTMADVLAYQAKKKQDEASKYGLNLTWTKDDQGNYHAWQPSQGGGQATEVQFAPGQVPQPAAGYLDTGTGYVPYAKAGGGILNPGARPAPAAPQPAGTAAPLDINTMGETNPPPVGVPHPMANPTPIPAAPAEVLLPAVTTPSGVIPKDVAGKTREETKGKAIGEAQFDYPTIANNAEQMLQAIDRLQTSPGYEYATGDFIRGNAPPIGNVFGMVPEGNKQAQFIQRFNEVQSKEFITMYDSLRGAGAITKDEGVKGTQAMSRLSRVGGDRKEFDAALNDLKDVVRRGLAVAQQKAGMGGGAPPPPSNMGRKTKSGVSWGIE